MKKSIQLGVAIALLLFCLPAWSQGEFTVTKTEGDVAEGSGVRPNFITQDTEGNILIIEMSWGRLSRKEWLEVFDKDLNRQLSQKLDLYKGEDIVAAHTIGGRTLLFSEIDTNYGQTNGLLRLPPKEVLSAIEVDAKGNQKRLKSLNDVYDLNENSGGMVFSFSADKSKLLIAVVSNKTRKKKTPPKVSCTVYDTKNLMPLWSKEVTCSPTEFDLYDCAVSNSGVALVRQKKSGIYTISESSPKATKLRIPLASGKVISESMIKELSDGRIVIAGSYGGNPERIHGWFFGEIDLSSNIVSVTKKQFEDEIFAFYGTNTSKFGKGKGGFYQFEMNTFSENKNGELLFSLERKESLHTSAGGTNKDAYYSPLFVKLNKDGSLNNTWIIPSHYIDDERKGGGHQVSFQGEDPIVIINGNSKNFRPKTTSHKKVKKVMFPEHYGSGYRGSRTETFAVRLNKDGSKTEQKFFSIMEDKMYASSNILLETEDGLIGAACYRKSLKLFKISF